MYIEQTLKQNDKMPLVSFIITYYNLPTWMLLECIESILVLSLRPYEREIIVIDDGSDVSPINELNDYRNEIIYIRQKNQGLSEARNTGVKIASGKYMQFVDGDDKLIQPAYEHCLDIARYNNPDMVMFDFTDKICQQTTFSDAQPVSGVEYMQHNNIRPTACGYLLRRAVLGDLRFTPGIYHEDEEFTPLLLLRTETVCKTDAKAYIYRQRPKSITSSRDKRNTLKRLNDKKDIIFRLHDMTDKLPYIDRIAMQRRIAQLTMDYIYNIITQTRNRQYLEKRLEELHKKNLYPLPEKDYTPKYKWFRRMTNSKIGLAVLMRALPLIKKER